GVQGLTQVQHHVVGDVHRQGQGAHAHGFEALYHPFGGGRGGVDSAHNAGDEPVASDLAANGGLVVNFHFEPVLVGFGKFVGEGGRQARVGEDRAGGVGVFAGHATHGEAVPA